MSPMAPHRSDGPVGAYGATTPERNFMRSPLICGSFQSEPQHDFSRPYPAHPQAGTIMGANSKIEWTDATAIIDRGGRRVRFYHRKRTDRPGTQERRAMRACGLAWCRGCQAWLDVTLVGPTGTCRPCSNAEYRAYYAQSEQFREGRRANRDRRRRSIERIPLEARELLLELFDHHCAYCETAEATTFDHFIPITKGGLTTPGNMLPACNSCNSRKRTKDGWLFIESLPTVPLFTVEYLAMAEY